MKAAPRLAHQQPEPLPHDMIELTKVIEALPSEQRSSIEPVLARVIESTQRRRRILTLVQEALSQLRLDMKYLMFDLEATRRERDDALQEDPEDE